MSPQEVAESPASAPYRIWDSLRLRIPGNLIRGLSQRAFLLYFLP
jgi:hypothetical protein